MSRICARSSCVCDDDGDGDGETRMGMGRRLLESIFFPSNSRRTFESFACVSVVGTGAFSLASGSKILLLHPFPFPFPSPSLLPLPHPPLLRIYGISSLATAVAGSSLVAMTISFTTAVVGTHRQYTVISPSVSAKEMLREIAVV